MEIQISLVLDKSPNKRGTFKILKRYYLWEIENVLRQNWVRCSRLSSLSGYTEVTSPA
ncbi:hypothetical protein HanHA300_Chr14g0534621 [Helianthus annuus]|nr:hypothetical protein HanHA300_Chr14g0534621 [Helianthus annuus]KAJ0486692.1 hypothetical protein HanHA89_Chr14g0582421 [Helianthus annuus]